jgi:hypothetical protein
MMRSEKDSNKKYMLSKTDLLTLYLGLIGHKFEEYIGGTRSTLAVEEKKKSNKKHQQSIRKECWKLMYERPAKKIYENQGEGI